MDLSMNLQNAFGRIATFTMLILLIHEPLLTSSFFLLEIRFYHTNILFCLFRVVSKYLILCEAIVKGGVP